MESKAAPLAVLVTLLMLILLVAPSDAAVACSNIVKNLNPCMALLRSSGGTGVVPPAACCAGFKNVATSVKTDADKRAICGCVRAAFKQTKVTDATAKALPGRCGITLPFTMSSNIKCSS